MEIHKNQFRLSPIPLTTGIVDPYRQELECLHSYLAVRPFIIDDVVLSEQNDLNSEDTTAVHDFLAQKVEDMIKQAEEISKSRVPLKPLIRLRLVI